MIQHLIDELKQISRYNEYYIERWRDISKPNASWYLVKYRFWEKFQQNSSGTFKHRSKILTLTKETIRTSNQFIFAQQRSRPASWQYRRRNLVQVREIRLYFCSTVLYFKQKGNKGFSAFLDPISVNQFIKQRNSNDLPRRKGRGKKKKNVCILAERWPGRGRKKSSWWSEIFLQSSQIWNHCMLNISKGKASRLARVLQIIRNEKWENNNLNRLVTLFTSKYCSKAECLSELCVIEMQE